VIELRAAEKRFGDTVALHPTDLCFTGGQVTVLVGPSGCGKSTVLRLIAGLEAPTNGLVEFDGERVGKGTLLALRRRMGYVIQEGGLFPHLTAADNVLLMARHLKRPLRENRARLDWLRELTCLPADSLRRYPLELSGGERQRVSLMRALMLDPEVLLLDEPLGALDPIMRLALQMDLKSIFARLKKTVVMVTHDVSEAAFLAHTVVLLREGRVVQEGTFEDLRERPSHPFVSAFLSAQRRPEAP
jgi:osmoprotectant transport system ATP-binding protein